MSVIPSSERYEMTGEINVSCLVKRTKAKANEVHSEDVIEPFFRLITSQKGQEVMRTVCRSIEPNQEGIHRGFMLGDIRGEEAISLFLFVISVVKRNQVGVEGFLRQNIFIRIVFNQVDFSHRSLRAILDFVFFHWQKQVVY